MTPLPYLHLERHVSMDSTSEENKAVTAVEEQAAAQPEKAAEEKSEPKHEAAEKVEPKHEARASKDKQEHRHDGRRHDERRGRSKGRPGQDKPAAPMGALQQALKKTKSSSDWKAFHDAQVAAGREQKTFWLTAAEAERVRRFIHKIREKAEKEAARQAEIAARRAKEKKEGKAKPAKKAPAMQQQSPLAAAPDRQQAGAEQQ